MKRNSGQVIIAVVILFALTIFMSLIYFMLFVAGGDRGNSQFLQDAEPQVQYKIGEVKKRSVITTTMDDFLFRVDDNQEYDGIPKGKYDDKTARKILSYYVSTPPPSEDQFTDDKIYINGEDYPTSEVKSDLQSYFRYKMEKHWAWGAEPVSYRLEIQGGKQENIVVQTDGYEPQASHSGHGYTVATVNTMAPSDSVRLFLWTSGSNSVWGVSQ